MITNALLITWAALSILSALITVTQIGKERKPITPQTAVGVVAVHMAAVMAITWALVK